MNQSLLNSNDNLLELAQAAGFDVISDPSLEIKKEAARLLPLESGAIGYDLAGEVLAVVTDHIPSPADFRELERQSGMQIMLSVALPSVFAEIKSRFNVHEDSSGVPLSIGPALQEAVLKGASDVHMAVGQPPLLRINGELTPLPGHPPLSNLDMKNAAKWIAGDAMENFNGDHDCAVTYAESRWRVSVYHQRQSLALAIRRIPSDVPQLEDLGLPESVKALTGLNQGLVLFCGPTGSGKSTSLAALLSRINRTRSCHIITIEDPIEYVHTSQMATVHQREVGDDTEDFASGLRSVLRQDPDVILVGELRDLETMKMALTAAETGHLVLATVHASTAPQAYTRMIDSFPPEQQSQVRSQLASVSKAVVAQRLLTARTARGEKTRALAVEVLLATNATQNLLRDNRLHEMPSLLDSERNKGMKSFDYSLAELVSGGKISQETGEAYATDIVNFNTFLTNLGIKVAFIDTEPDSDLYGDAW